MRKEPTLVLVDHNIEFLKATVRLLQNKKANYSCGMVTGSPITVKLATPIEQTIQKS
jgi:hypothetical protein